MKRLLRNYMDQHPLSVLNQLRTIRNRKYFGSRFGEFQSKVKQELFPAGSQIEVRSGPFKGMLYIDEVVWGSITPKWLGSYEAELHCVIHEFLCRGQSNVIDIGCAEGYYAVGLAKLMPNTKVFAFDTDFISRRQARCLARLNGVDDRLKIGKYCSSAELNRLTEGDAAVICDIEGYEAVLLDPELVPNLQYVDMLVEVHENSDESNETEELLKHRFCQTHQIIKFRGVSRDQWIEENGNLLNEGASFSWLHDATAEHRVRSQVWLSMTAKQKR